MNNNINNNIKLKLPNRKNFEDEFNQIWEERRLKV